VPEIKSRAPAHDIRRVTSASATAHRRHIGAQFAHRRSASIAGVSSMRREARALRTRAAMRSLLLPLFLLSSFTVAACTADSTGASSSSPSTTSPPASADESGDSLTTEREIGECGTPMKPLTVTLSPRDEAPSFLPKVTAKGTANAIVFLAENGGVDCDGAQIEAKQKPDGFIDVALRFRRQDGEPIWTNCKCSPDVKGTIKDLAAGHYELRVVREDLEDGKVVEQVLTPTSIGVDVGQ
jgi:hypothetical protein